MAGRLDTLRVGLYKTRPLRVGAVVAALSLLVPVVAWAEKDPSGAQLPDGAERVGESRYRAREDWEGVQKYYRTVYPVANYPRRPIANQPGVKAVHIENPSGRGFAGINIYQANDEVRIFVVPTGEKAAPAKKKAKAKG